MSEIQESGTRRKIKLTYIVIAVAISCLMLGASFAIILQGTSTPSIPTVIEPGSMVSPSSYVIFKDGATTYVRNGTTGAIASSGLSSGLVIQSVIDGMNLTGGGSIFIKKANYTLTSKILVTGPHFHIEAETGTVFNSALLPCFEVDGIFFDGPFQDTVNDIQLINLAFYYTGSPQNGKFVYLHSLQYDYRYQGEIHIENMMIWRTHDVLSTNQHFVGLGLQDVVGATYAYLAVKNFGTGIQYNRSWDPGKGAWEQGSTNLYEHVTLSNCTFGYWATTSGMTSEIWNQLKVLFCGNIAFYGDGPLDVTLNSCNFESIASTAIWYSGRTLTATNCMFSNVNEYGFCLKFWGLTGENHALIQDCWFNNVDRCIYTERNVTLIGNSYTLPYSYQVWRVQDASYPYPTVIAIHDGYVTTAYGIAHITASTSVTFYHNLSDTYYWPPSLCLASFNTTATGAWSWVYTGGLNKQITITVENSGTYTVYWYASNSESFT